MRYIRLILGGVLLGAGLYFTPFFVFRFFLFGLLAFAVIRLLIGSRLGWHRGYGPWGHGIAFAGGPGMRGYGPMGFADKVRGMTDEEYQAFQERFQSGPWGHDNGYGCYGGRRRGWGCNQAQQAPETKGAVTEAAFSTTTNTEPNA